MRECGENDAKGMVSDIKGVLSLGRREIHKGWDLCLCGGSGGHPGDGVGGGGSSVDCSEGDDGGGGVDGSSGNSGVADGGESGACRSGGGGGSVVYRSVGAGLCRSG